MSAISMERSTPARASRPAVVVAADADAREGLARLLGGAGYAVAQRHDVVLPPIQGALVVLGDPLDGTTCVKQVRAIARQDPAASIVAVITRGTPNTVMRRILLAGAAGIVLEHQVLQALVTTARAVEVGQIAVPRALLDQIAPRPLSHREKQVLGLVALGLTNREIAKRVYLAESTVKSHLSSAFRKIDARSRAEAVARIQDPEGTLRPTILAVVPDAGLDPALDTVRLQEASATAR